MPRDYYDILGVTRSADDAEIKKSYRKLAKKYHPDVNKDDGASERFAEAQEAYDVLSDKDKRQMYDQVGPDFERYQQAGGGGYTFRCSLMHTDNQNILRIAIPGILLAGFRTSTPRSTNTVVRSFAFVVRSIWGLRIRRYGLP